MNNGLHISVVMVEEAKHLLDNTESTSKYFQKFLAKALVSNVKKSCSGFYMLQNDLDRNCIEVKLSLRCGKGLCKRLMITM